MQQADREIEREMEMEREIGRKKALVLACQ